MEKIDTLGRLKEAGYVSLSIKEEMRKNLISKLQKGEVVFQGIKGFDDTVLPDLERAILSRHSILLLGLRGQAKTRIARLLIHLLDEFIPVVEGSEINDDPLHPLSKFAKDLIAAKGDHTPITWLHRSERYVEKLATPDVSVADLIGDIDPIKAANQKLAYSDEGAIHYGLVPRANRSIFVINELPDLQPRIQVSLFNILQEGDLQIRGFKLRLPLDVEFVFTANPEDYTNRGSIITPLKDRIQSQILTHYPKTLDIAKEITRAEANLHPLQREAVSIPEIHRDLLENMVINARESEYTDEKSGVSARMSITALENLVSSAERRMILNNESSTTTRLSDFWGVIPAIIGKLELVYEGEQEGVYNVAIKLLDQAIKSTFNAHFPNPEKSGKNGDPYGAIKMWFQDGNEVNLLLASSDKNYVKTLESIPGLLRLVTQRITDKSLHVPMMEIVLHGLAQYNVIGRNYLDNTLSFKDPISDIFNMDEDEDDEDDYR
ncbi:MAG: sigma 54-interacting transcriptional regulator [Saprospiraceae bacterium]|nr:sigma 54-interacting transcriptional regulator [Saprospiraceae bacterium]